MVAVVPRMPLELASITEKTFHFTEDEERDGVKLVAGSLPHQLWELLTNRSEVLVHPYYDKLGTIDHRATANTRQHQKPSNPEQ